MPNQAGPLFYGRIAVDPKVRSPEQLLEQRLQPVAPLVRGRQCPELLEVGEQRRPSHPDVFLTGSHELPALY
ncbi:hypothetical protein ACH4Y0_34340 [Streptomyces sp. NPDC020707]|uniref:hypothetical protein n=1 Tax=Streptomyces sp. NPDC020707 TaxID=3365084 RepID=UPI0037B24F47